MADLSFPEIESIIPSVPSVSPSAPTAQVTQPLTASSPVVSPPIVPDLGVSPSVPVSVPNVLNNSKYQPIPEWTYRRFHIMDIFYSKIGISAITSLLTFSILSVTNPPFVQESNENPIEISRPSFSILYCISLVIFVIMMVVPVSN